MRLPREVDSILAWWIERARAALGPRFESVVLTGGVTLGDFAPGWSDVDVCVVLPDEPGPDERAAVERIHAETRRRYVVERCDGWRSGQAVEEVLLPGGRMEPFDRYVLAHHGVALIGEKPDLAPPPPEGLLDQLRRDLETLASPEALDRSAIWHAGMLHWTARSLVFWRDGEMLGKTTALEREIAAGSPLAEAFRLALDVRARGSATAGPREAELRNAFLSARERAAEMLGEYS